MITQLLLVPVTTDRLLLRLKLQSQSIITTCTVIVEHSLSGVIYYFGRLCLYVRLSISVARIFSIGGALFPQKS